MFRLHSSKRSGNGSQITSPPRSFWISFPNRLGRSSGRVRKNPILSRLLKYAQRHYAPEQALARVRDRRVAARIPTTRIVHALFLMVCLRLGSLNAIEEAMRKEARRSPWRRFIGGELPSADRLGEVAAELELGDLRALLCDHHKKRKRAKTLPPLPGKLRIVLLDGHEMAASYLRCCPDCQHREVVCKGETRIQYYHRYVMAYLLFDGGRLLLDLELQRKGEGEIAAAMRLFHRLQENCPRAFNVVAGDALYLDPNLCKIIVQSKKDFVAVLKNENRELIQDFRGLCALDTVQPLRLEYGRKQCLCYDLEGLESWSQLGHPVRVVSSQEHSSVRRQHRRRQDETPEVTTSEWLWATTLTKSRAGTAVLLRIGHGRWKIENHGFNELVTQWHADHVYYHDPNAIMAILLLLFLAYNLFHVWLSRGLKPQLRQRYTAMYFAHLLRAAFYSQLRAPT